jgi:hypothetical protein
MSATRDKSQKVAFVYSNLYKIYRDGKNAAQEAGGVVKSEAAATSPQAEVSSSPLVVPTGVSPGLTRSNAVLKAGDVAVDGIPGAPKIDTYSPASLLGKRVRKPESLAASEIIGERIPAAPRAAAVAAPRPSFPASNPALESLKDNLKALNSLHSRLRFMLQELEELVKE